MEEMVEKILSKIGGLVEFTYPEGDIYKGVMERSKKRKGGD